MSLSQEVKEQLISDINRGDESALRGMMETLKICMGENPNVIPVEFTLSQIAYLEKWSQTLNGTEISTLIRMMVDSMMRIKPL